MGAAPVCILSQRIRSKSEIGGLQCLHVLHDDRQTGQVVAIHIAVNPHKFGVECRRIKVLRPKIMRR